MQDVRVFKKSITATVVLAAVLVTTFVLGTFAYFSYQAEQLEKTRTSLIVIILLTDALLAIVLSQLLERLIFKPIRALQQFAAKVNQSGGEIMPVEPLHFSGELEGLRGSLDNMLHLLKDRYQALQSSEERYRTMVEFSRQCVAVIVDDRFVHINPAGARMFGGESPADMIGRSMYDFVVPSQEPAIKERKQRVLDQGLPAPPAEFALLRKDGLTLCVISQAVPFLHEGRPAVLYLMLDVSDRKRLEDREHWRSRILESLAAGNPLAAVLELIVESVEAEDREAVCSILLVDEQRKYLLNAVAPNLPESFVRACHGAPIGKGKGSCGAAVLSGQRVISEDILTSPDWEAYQDLAREANVRSCWSEPFFSSDGKVLGTVAIYHRVPCRPTGDQIQFLKYAANLTALAVERKQADLAVQRSEFHYRTLFESAQDAILIMRGECILSCNPHSLKLLGSRLEDVVGQSFVRFSPDWQPGGLGSACKLKEKIQAALLGAPQRFEWRCRRLDGTEFDTEASVNRMELDEQPLLLLIVRDITARKLSERLVHESEEKFAKAFRSSPNGIAITDMATGRYIDVNESFCGIYGYAKEEMLGHTSLELGVFDSPEHRERVIAPVRTVGHVKDAMLHMRTRGGEARTLLFSAERIELGGNQCMVLVIFDITARLETEEQLENTSRQLRALTRRLQSLREEERTHLAREIHDHLGQLLTALCLDLRLLERRTAGVSDAELRASLHSKIASARQLADETITSVQKIATELRPAILDRLGLEAAIEVEARAFHSRTGVNCQWSLPSDAVALEPDQAIGVFRIFQEILTNVARHSHAAHLNVRLSHEEDHLLLEVDDDGVGIQAGDIGKSTSLGLLGMKERAAILGGKITFNRKDPRGTTVAARIPLNGKVEQLA